MSASASRGERTREHILDTAEILLGDRGVDAVSLREIRIAAGQRNSSAIQFHFGDTAGLLEALAKRHMTRIGELSADIRAELIEEGRGDEVRALVAVMVACYADYIEQGASQRAWVKIASSEVGRPERLVRDFEAYSPTAIVDAGMRVFEHLETFLPSEVAMARMITVGNMGVHTCAERARALDATGDGPRRRVLDARTFRQNLLAMTRAAMFAPLEDPQPRRRAQRRGRG
jgi:AcrR family transcriptional regulator